MGIFDSTRPIQVLDQGKLHTVYLNRFVLACKWPERVYSMWYQLDLVHAIIIRNIWIEWKVEWIEFRLIAFLSVAFDFPFFYKIFFECNAHSQHEKNLIILDRMVSPRLMEMKLTLTLSTAMSTCSLPAADFRWKDACECRKQAVSMHTSPCHCNLNRFLFLQLDHRLVHSDSKRLVNQLKSGLRSCKALRSYRKVMLILHEKQKKK